MPVYNTGDPRVDQAFGNLASIFAPDPRREIAVRQSIADMHYKNAQRHAIEQKMLFDNYLLGRRQKIGDQFGRALQAQYGSLSPDMAAVLAGTLGVRDGNVDQTATGIGTLSSIAALLGGDQGEDAQRRAMALRGQMADNNTRMTTGYDTKVRGDDRAHDFRKLGATISATNARHAQLMANNLEVQRLKDEQARWETLNSPQKLGQGDTVMFPGGQHEPYTSPVPLLHNADPGDATFAVDGNGVRTVREADPAAAAAAAGKAAPGPNSNQANLEALAAKYGVPHVPGTGQSAFDSNVVNIVTAMVLAGDDVPEGLEVAFGPALGRLQSGGLAFVDNGDGTRTAVERQTPVPGAPTMEQVRASGQAPAQAVQPRPPGQTTTAGKPVYEDANGEQYSERTETIRLSDGRYYVVPTIDDQGNPIPNIEDYYRENGPVDPVNGGTLPSFDSIAQADDYAMKRSTSLLPQADNAPEMPAVAPRTVRPGDRVQGPNRNAHLAVETGRAALLFSSYAGAINELMNLYNYDPNTNRLGPGFRPAEGTLLANVLDVNPAIRHYARGVVNDAEGQRYDRLAFQSIEPLLRFRSGAATPDAEVARYYSNLIPLPGSTDTEIKARFQVLVREARAAETILNKYGLSLAGLAELPDGDANWLAARQEFERVSPRAGRYTSSGQEWIKKHLPPDVAARI